MREIGHSMEDLTLCQDRIHEKELLDGPLAVAIALQVDLEGIREPNHADREP